MQRLLAPPLPPGCPWSGFTPPNVDWCEQELCGWIVNPADTWSNLAYVALGLWMWRSARGRSDLRLFGPASVAVGVFSFAYHASYTWLLQFFDFVGMFVFCFTVIARNATRLGWIAPRRELRFFALGVLGASAAVPLLFEAGVAIQLSVAVCIAVAVAQELALRRRAPADASFSRSYGVGLALLALAGLASLLDVTRLACDPTNHWLQGHAVWHVLTALALLAFFRFYAALPSASPAH
jgi:Ceramidase